MWWLEDLEPATSEATWAVAIPLKSGAATNPNVPRPPSIPEATIQITQQTLPLCPAWFALTLIKTPFRQLLPDYGHGPEQMSA